VLAAFALVFALAATLGAGIWIGSGGHFFPQRTPRVVYVTPSVQLTIQPSGAALPSDPSTATPGAETTGRPGGTPEAIPAQTAEATVTLPPTAAPKPPTATPKPPTPVPTDPPRPDLAVVMFQLGRIVPSCNLEFAVQLSVKNQGSGASPHAVVAVVMDISATDKGTVEATVGVPILQQGAAFSQDIPILVNGDCGQYHRLEVRVDESGTIGETSLMNNLASIDYYLGIEPMN
jgi:hypothetical protein